MLAPIRRQALTLRGVRFNSSAAAPSSSLPIPPKLLTPNSLQGPGGNTSRMDEVVSFYKALPKGEVKKKSTAFHNPGNGKPIVATIGVLFLIGYTIDYNMHLSE